MEIRNAKFENANLIELGRRAEWGVQIWLFNMLDRVDRNSPRFTQMRRDLFTFSHFRLSPLLLLLLLIG